MQVACPKCNHLGPHRAVMRKKPFPHYAELRCIGCGRHLRWLPDPNSGKPWPPTVATDESPPEPAAQRDLW